MLNLPGLTELRDARAVRAVVAMYLEHRVEPLFHPDSYGYRPGRTALEAVAVCRERCCRYDWVIDLDIQAFFDSVDHELMLRAVAAHTDARWVLLYVRRWLTAPMQQTDGGVVKRNRGAPQGAPVSEPAHDRVRVARTPRWGFVQA